ncbi:MAG: DUF3368 domain-containing protein [Verrucomicrobiota bacterium]
MGNSRVLNVSPLILLAKAQVIHLVLRVCEPLVIPEVTLQEVRVGKMSDAGRAWLEGERSVFVKKSGPIPSAISRFGLGLGETQVLAWTMENTGFEGVLDDLKARRCAKQLNLPIIGSLRVLIILKEQGLIPSVQPAIDHFRGAGSYFSEALIQETLKLAGEN